MPSVEINSISGSTFGSRRERSIVKWYRTAPVQSTTATRRPVALRPGWLRGAGSVPACDTNAVPLATALVAVNHT